MEKVLMLASVASMIDKFNMDNIDILKETYSVDVAANFSFGSITPDARVAQFKKELEDQGINVFNILIPRKIFAIKKIISAYKEVKKLCYKNKYKMVHCHSPIGGVIARLACRKLRKTGTKVIYTAHGFHFFKGAPLKNWLIYFPVEWICSFFTDILITINKEDYSFAQKYMHAKSIDYIPGVGVDVDYFKNLIVDKKEIKKSVGIAENEITILSVGELNDNKNHETIIRAISKLKNYNITYVICGQGDKKEYLRQLANDLNVKLLLLGYRDDVAKIYKCCDVFVFPSMREGLGLAAIEAMAAGMPVIASDVGGIPDYLDKNYRCKPKDVGAFLNKIKFLINNRDKWSVLGKENQQVAERFDEACVMSKMQLIYGQGQNLSKDAEAEFI